MMTRFIFKCCTTIGVGLFLSGRADGVTSTIGLNGINASGLGVNGRGIAIGQVEVERPEKRVADGGPDTPAMANFNVIPANVFRRAGSPNTADVSLHAEEVAGVMISADTSDGAGTFANSVAPTGVSPGAALYASAYNVPTGPGEPEAAISAQHVALQNAGDVRAINFSFGEAPNVNEQLDGNSLLTKFVDWSADIHDTLYVIAGNEDVGGIPVPTDNYNGVTIAFSNVLGGVYRQLDTSNFYGEDAIGPRTSVDLVAPSREVELVGLNNTHTFDSGTSFAAPLVTGTVAVLQQSAEARLSAATPHWDSDARRHEVMKAVLLNSADKIKDDGAIAPVGSFLGMEKTVVDSDGTTTWLDSSAFTDVGPGDTVGQVPLDLRLGAGQLNANRAKIQFTPGEYDANAASTPAIGWDFGTTTGDSAINKYAFGAAINGSTYISVTLAWDRQVAFDVDAGTSGMYDVNDTFVDDCCFTNLDLYLMPAGATNLSQAILRPRKPLTATILSSMCFSKFRRRDCTRFGCTNLILSLAILRTTHLPGGPSPQTLSCPATTTVTRSWMHRIIQSGAGHLVRRAV